MASSEDSQEDLFANTQIKTRTDHVTESSPNKWINTKNFDFPWLIMFLWGGQANPFVLVYLIELDPQDVDGKWLTGILSPKSRCKHRNVKFYPDFSVSIYGKVHKGNFYLIQKCVTPIERRLF